MDLIPSLQELFPSHPGRHIKLLPNKVGDPGSKKRIVTIRSGASENDYAQHLSAESTQGPGALGVFPAHPGGVAGSWIVWWVALDYDTVDVKGLYPLISTLEDFGIYSYWTAGTTGRGGHLYIFFNEPLLQDQAHKVVIAIADVSEHLSLPRPEMRPSSSAGPGTGILLPYRGAERDGYGANPLIDPVSGNYIPLENTEEEVYSTGIESLFALTKESKSYREINTASSSSEEDDFRTYAEGLEAWQEEVRRIEPLWTKNRRQDLALGLTAYGLKLGVPPARIRSDIEALEENSSEPEVPKRQEDAVDRTVRRHEEGERIAGLLYYRKAGVEPPPYNQVAPLEALLKLQLLRDRASMRLWKGMAGGTNRDVYLTLIEVGQKYGKPYDRGVEVSTSTRDLALKARVSHNSVLRSLERLKNAGLVERTSGSKGTRSGSLGLLIEQDALDCYEFPAEADLKARVGAPNSESVLRFRWGAGKLGKLSGAILEAIHRLQPSTRPEIARALNRKSRDIKRQLKKLEERGLILRDGDTYLLPPNFEEILQESLSLDGTLQTDKRHEQVYEMQREAHYVFVARQQARRRERGAAGG